MQTIDLTETEAADLVAAIANHLPMGASLGRLVVARPGCVLADLAGVPAAYGVDDDGAWRLAELPGGERELTRWCDGYEVDRRMIRAK